MTNIHVSESAVCRSGEVPQGMLKPHECEAFGSECPPRHPLGATMVSSEGACAAYYLYAHWRPRESIVAESPHEAEVRAKIDLDTRVRSAPPRHSPDVVMGHGGGGVMSGELVEHLFLPAYARQPTQP